MATSKIIGDEPCPACRSVGNDKTGNHLIIFEDGKFCNRCQLCIGEDGTIINGGVHEWNPYDVTNDTPEVIPFSPSIPSMIPMPKIAPNVHSGSIPDKPCTFRGVREEVRGKYGVNGDASCQLYPVYVDGSLYTHKKRSVPKDFVLLQGCKGLKVNFFGQHIFGGEKSLLITEGEEDAMSAYQMLQKYGIACVSLPFGDKAGPITDNLEWIKKYSDVVLCLDQDAAGLKCTREITKLYPFVKVMTMTEKDANDMLVKGKSKEFVNDFFKAERYKPASIVAVSDAKMEALVAPEMGLDYPFPGLTRMTYGFRLRRVIGIGAAPGAGKTCLVKSLQTHLMNKHHQKIGVFSLEETPGEAMREMAGYIMNLPLDRPGTVYDEGVLNDILTDLEGKMMLYNSENYQGWDDIEEAIRYMASEGVKWFFIDPISALTAHLSASDANEFLQEAMWSMAKLVKELDVTIWHINHLNSVTGGKDHGAGGRVYASQFTGSRAQWRYSTDIFGIERDQYAEDEIERNTNHLVALKYRKPSRGGSIDLLYDDKSGTMSEITKTTGVF